MHHQTLTGLLDLTQSLYETNDSGNAPVLLMLGKFKFSLNTAAFTEFQRNSEFRYGAVMRLGQRDALQFLGPGEDRITLPGVVYPDWRSDAFQVDNLRQLAASGQPQQLIDSGGSLLGWWVIERVEEKQTDHKADGSPRRYEFTLSLLRAGDDQGSDS